MKLLPTVWHSGLLKLIQYFCILETFLSWIILSGRPGAVQIPRRSLELADQLQPRLIYSKDVLYRQTESGEKLLSDRRVWVCLAVFCSFTFQHHFVGAVIPEDQEKYIPKWQNGPRNVIYITSNCVKAYFSCQPDTINFKHPHPAWQTRV